MKRLVIFMSFLFLNFTGISQSKDSLFYVNDDLYKKVSYYDNSGLRETGYYDSGKNRVGEWVTYHRNGVIASVGRFSKNKKHGEWLVYNYTGNLLGKMSYEIGSKVGKWLRYDEDGNILATIEH